VVQNTEPPTTGTSLLLWVNPDAEPPPFPGGGGGGGMSWVQSHNMPLDTLTGLTKSGGTWSIVSGQLQVVSPNTSTTVYVVATGVPIAHPPTQLIVEVEIEMLGADVGSAVVGIYLADAAINGGGSIGARFDGNSFARVELVGGSSWGGIDLIPSLSSGWHKLRMVCSGGRIFAYVDGVLQIVVWQGVASLAFTNYPGIYVKNKTVRFRNLKTWALISDELPA
jgi:hypothetical protein